MKEKDTLQEKTDEIKRQALQKAEVYGDRKWMRVKRTFLVLSVAIYLIAFINDAMNGWEDYLRWILVAPSLSGGIMFVSYAVIGYMWTKSLEEEKELAKMQGMIDAINMIKWGIL